MILTKQEYIRRAQFRSAVRRFLRSSELQARQAGVTRQQHEMMVAIKGTPARDWATLGEIAEALQINHNAAVGLVNRAAAAGLVTRSPHPDDGRRVCVSLTPEGEAILADLSDGLRQELQRMAPVLEALLAVLR